MADASPDSSQSSLEVDVISRCPRWAETLNKADGLCRIAAHACYLAINTAEGSGPTEVSIVLADDVFVRDLNREYRGRDGTTNVLSFPASAIDGAHEIPNSSEAPRLLGDVVLAFETVSTEAEEQDKKLDDHLCHLVVHGMLHLLGYDHEQEQAAEKMEALEIEILAGMGIADPYGYPYGDGVPAGAGD